MNVEIVRGVTNVLQSMYGELDIVDNSKSNLKFKIKQNQKNISIRTDGLQARINMDMGIYMPQQTEQKLEVYMLELNVSSVAMALYVDLQKEVGNLAPNFENMLVLRRRNHYYFICKHVINDYTLATFVFESNGTDLQEVRNWKLVGTENVRVRRCTDELSLSTIQMNKQEYQVFYRQGHILY